MTDSQLTLPGLEPATTQTASPLVEAVKASMVQLHQLGKIQPQHQLHVQLALQLAQAIDHGSRSGRASAVAMASKELRETFDRLDPPEEGMGSDAAEKLAKLMNVLEAAVESGGTLPEGWVP